jgi:hypothetical protein
VHQTPYSDTTKQDAVKQPALQLQALKIKVHEFRAFAEEYYKRLLPEMRDSQYDIDSLIEKMEDGYERHYMKIVAFHNGQKMGHGLACVNVDQTYREGYRAFIRHVSVIRFQQFDEAM